MIPSLLLKIANGTVEMSTPSMKMLPAVRFSMRNRLTIRVDLPEPVRPATPIFSPPATVKSSREGGGEREVREKVSTD